MKFALRRQTPKEKADGTLRRLGLPLRKITVGQHPANAGKRAEKQLYVSTANPASPRQKRLARDSKNGVGEANLTIDLDIVREKMELRAEMKARRALFNEGERARASIAMCLRVASWLQTRPERSLGVYLARPQEICLDLLIEELLRQGYEIAAPRVDAEDGIMDFWRLNSLADIEIGPWNVRQPWPKEKIEDLPLILAPGLAFDRAGGRLGTGGGWYDSVLQASQTVVGVCFDCQILPRVPLEDHDCPVHFVTSESRWIEVEKSGEFGSIGN